MFDIIRNLYTRKDYEWLNTVDFSNTSHITIYNYLLSDSSTGIYIRKLNKYLYGLSTKCFVALLHTYIPKRSRAPFLEGKNKESKKNLTIDLLLEKIRRYFKYSEKEFFYIRPYVLLILKGHIKEWCLKFGIKV